MSRKRVAYAAGFIFMAAVGLIALGMLILRFQVDKAVAEAQTNLDQLIIEGGEEHAMFYVERVRELLKEIEKHTAHPTRNHDKVMALANQAIKDAQAGIDEAKKKRCEELIKAIQSDLIKAQKLEAEYFIPDLWNECSADFEELLSHYWKKEYDVVLRLGPKLKKQTAALALETAKASAEYQLATLRERVEKMRWAGADEAFRDRFEQLQEMPRRAQAQYEKGDYEAVESTAQSAHLLAAEMDGTVVIESNLGAFGVKVISNYEVLRNIAIAVEQTTHTLARDAVTTASVVGATSPDAAATPPPVAEPVTINAVRWTRRE